MNREATSTSAVIERVRDDLMTGRYFTLHAASQRSRYGYHPVVSRRGWAHALGTLARMAEQSDMLAQIAVAVVGRVNLYGTDPEECAHIYEAAVAALAAQYDDVVGRSGPDGGRYNLRDYTLAERIQLAAWLGEATRLMDASHAHGVGWAVAAIADAESVRLPSTEAAR